MTDTWSTRRPRSSLADELAKRAERSIDVLIEVTSAEKNRRRESTPKRQLISPITSQPPRRCDWLD